MKKVDYQELRDCLFWSWKYNGMDDEMLEMTYHLLHFEPQSKYDHLSRDDESMHMSQDFWDNVWSVLVQLFGDYGTSPRVGWVEDTKGAAGFLVEGLKSTWWSGENAEKLLDWILNDNDGWLKDKIDGVEIDELKNISIYEYFADRF